MRDRRTFLATGLSALAAPAFAAPATDYAAVLAQAYGAPVTPDAVHARALSAVRAAQARADVLLRGQGLKDGSVGERLRTLAKDPRWLYPDSDAGRDRAVAEMNARLAAFRPRLGEAFGGLPIAAAEVRRMSPADVAAGRGGYREAPRDGQPGAYYINLKAICERPAWSLSSVGFHEVIPGHLLQLPLQAAAAPPADRLKAAGAYFEAWAIYAEQLACDLGAYRGDPRGEIGYLQWRLFRLGRVIADIGLHAGAWTRERAIAELTGLQGQSIAFITIEADVDRMISTPGKYAAEALGALAIADWRPRERARWPAFHRAVLVEGPWPFGELERRLRS
ncbi:DUF885 family protein [Phenylobacterium sp.]|uniref:DUF885 family protein n=1 Tax=Phenylobacterium sp. TaxID=1871053 RepID=UPI00356A9083